MTKQDTTRYARGVERRSALVEAAAGLLLGQGLAALSHRAVAARANLPLASTTYYFSSVDDLRNQALHLITNGWVAKAAAVVDALPERLTTAAAVQAVIGIVGGDTSREQLLLQYERYLEAGRHERLRPLVVEMNARLVEFTQDVLRRTTLPVGPDDARLLLAVTDGAVVTALAEGEPVQAAATAALRRLLAWAE